MQYMLLIYRNEQEFAKVKDAEKQAVYQAYGAFTQGIIKSGHYVGGNPLQPGNHGRSRRCPTIDPSGGGVSEGLSRGGRGQRRSGSRLSPRSANAAR